MTDVQLSVPYERLSSLTMSDDRHTAAISAVICYAVFSDTVLMDDIRLVNVSMYMDV